LSHQAATLLSAARSSSQGGIAYLELGKPR